MPEKKTIERAHKDQRGGQGSIDAGGRVRTRRDGPHPRRQARRAFNKTGDRDRIARFFDQGYARIAVLLISSASALVLILRG